MNRESPPHTHTEKRLWGGGKKKTQVGGARLFNAEAISGVVR